MRPPPITYGFHVGISKKISNLSTEILKQPFEKLMDDCRINEHPTSKGLTIGSHTQRGNDSLIY